MCVENVHETKNNFNNLENWRFISNYVLYFQYGKQFIPFSVVALSSFTGTTVHVFVFPSTAKFIFVIKW